MSHGLAPLIKIIKKHDGHPVMPRGTRAISLILTTVLLTGCGQFFSSLLAVDQFNPDGSLKPTASLQEAPTAFEGGEAEFVLSLSAPTKRDVEINFEVRDGSGQSGLDFPPMVGSVVVPSGETQAKIRVPTHRREGIQGVRTLIVVITQVDGVRIGSASATGEIADIQADEGMFTDLNKAPVTQQIGRLNDSTILFFGYSAANGVELWKSDGTAAGTVLVKDINPGPASSMTSSMLGSVKFIEYSGKNYFPARTDANGYELWATDGTPAGTQMVTDLVPGTASGWSSGLVTEHGFLYFIGADANKTTELYRTDGTAAGTTKITSFAGGVQGWKGAQDEIFAVQGRLVFIGYCSSSWNMCGYDGTTAYTVAGSDGSSFFGAPGFVCGNTLYMVGGSNNYVYATNGTAASAVQLSSATYASFVGCSGGSAFFFLNTAANGNELWKSGGTPATTAIVKDHVAGAGSITIGNPGGSYDLARSNFALDSASATPRLIYTANDGTAGTEPFISDGLAAGTNLLKNIQPGSLNSFPGNYYFDAATAQVFFAAEDQTTGTEVWVSDFTSAGTRQILDLATGPAGSMPTSFFRPSASSPLFFLAYDQASRKSRLFKTDGTPSGTSALPVDVPNRGSGVSIPRELANGNLILGGDDGSWGAMIWKSLGRPDSLEKFVDLMPNGGCTAITPQISSGNVTYFFYADAATGIELWRTDGTATGTMLLKDINPGSASSLPSLITKLGDKLLFLATTATEGAELWISDGTGFGTVLLSDIYAGTTGSNPMSLTVMNDKLYFTATTAAAGFELWVTDGTGTGTTMVKDINPGPNSSIPNNLKALGSKLIFQATDGVLGYELWSSDGTAAGTTLISDIYSGAGSSDPMYFVKLGDKLIFRANDGISGTEPWITDGTAMGTTILKDLHPGANSSNPSDLTATSNKVFFSARDALNTQSELVVTDGTEAGTILLDIIPGASGLSPGSLTAVGSTMFFRGTSPEHGGELWRSDGTIANTTMVKDLAPGALGSDPTSLKEVDGVLFYTATTPYEGLELHVAHPLAGN